MTKLKIIKSKNITVKDLNYLLDNDKTINTIKQKYKNTLISAKNNTEGKSFSLGVLHFFLFNIIISLPNLFIEDKEGILAIYVLLNSLVTMASFVLIVSPMLEGKKSELRGFKNYCLSFFFKNKDNRLLDNSIYKEFGIITKKSKENINDYYNHLTKEENDIYNYFFEKNCLSEKGNIRSYSDIAYSFLENYLNNNDKTEIIKNKKIILKVIDRLTENSIEEVRLTNLYIDKIQKKGEFKNNKLNQINELTDIKKETFKNENIVIKQI
jgi:hypothetical protein